ncbi:hypothetical protein DFH06DRAFT_449197 [Mycena polygramma]|nr:hypothetical protein DFH06DRAFT_449197 [Mycena polygramma]
MPRLWDPEATLRPNYTQPAPTCAPWQHAKTQSAGPRLAHATGRPKVTSTALAFPGLSSPRSRPTRIACALPRCPARCAPPSPCFLVRHAPLRTAHVLPPVLVSPVVQRATCSRSHSLRAAARAPLVARCVCWRLGPAGSFFGGIRYRILDPYSTIYETYTPPDPCSLTEHHFTAHCTCSVARSPFSHPPRAYI